MADTGALLYLTLVDDQGIEFYHLNLSKQELDESLIHMLSNMVHGFRNMVNLDLISMQYQDYTIYFQQTSSFMSVLLTSDHPSSEELVTRFFQKFIDDHILEQFMEYNHGGVNWEREELDKAIFKIIYNLNFMNELSDLKKTQNKWRV
ncbi:MAG: hypothetical protein ACXAE3_05295 [Candidatus Kariarchaeaceae archaeon]|jgi:hypothetical protein